MATTKKDVNISDITNKYINKGQTMSKTKDTQPVTKVYKVGVRQIATAVPRLDIDGIKSQVATLENKGSKVAPMYVLDAVKEALNLSDDEYNKLHELATKPRAKRTPKPVKTDNSEVLTLSKELSSKAEKLESVNKDIEKLTGERDTLQREVDELLSKLAVKK
jgi:hypothetical protein